jgi:hypothetical protein
MKLLATAALLLIGASTSRATSAGGEPFDFLFLDAGARSAAMGGAYTALANDSNALLYNPGALGMVQRTEATFMDNQYFQGVTQEYVGFASSNGFGFNLNHLGFGSVGRTTYNNPGGTGDSTGLDDWAVSAGYGHTIFDSLSVGAEIKYIRESIDASAAVGFAVDVGAMYKVPFVPGLTLGAALQNMGPTVTFVTANENLPLNVRLGAGYDFTVLGHDNTVSLDVTKERSQNVLVGVGVESRVISVLPLRFGFTTTNDAGLGITAGFGYIWGRASFDYAIAPYGDLGLTNRISVTFHFGDVKRAASQKLAEAAVPTMTTAAAAAPEPSAPTVTAAAAPAPSTPTAAAAVAPAPSLPAVVAVAVPAPSTPTMAAAVAPNLSECPGSLDGVGVDGSGCPSGSPAGIQIIDKPASPVAPGSK